MKRLGVTPAEIMRHCRGGRLVILPEYDGTLWFSDSYFMARARPKSAVADLLADYNLPLEPMSCDVGRTIRRTGVPRTTADALLSSAAAAVPATRESVAGVPALIENGYGTVCQVWRLPSGLVSLDHERAAFVARVAGTGSWHGTTVTAPLVWKDDEGSVNALLMPVRTLFSDEQTDQKKATRKKAAA